MSGFEVVGVVLGILPLLISAAENYENTYKPEDSRDKRALKLLPFKRYKRYAPELEEFQRNLQTQKAIFKNQCQLLLSALSGRQAAKEMLREKEHRLWKDDDLERRLASQLGCERDACEGTIRSISQKLKSIEKKSEAFGEVIQQNLPLCAIGDIAWRSRVGKKWEFAFSATKLDKHLDDLRKLNQDFCTLAQQATQLEDLSQDAFASSRESRYIHPEGKIQECRMVQKASVRLYAALGRSCQTHVEHSAHFRLDAQCIDSITSCLQIVRFNLAFTHHAIELTARPKPVWIMVESSFEHNASEEQQRQSQGNEAKSTSTVHKMGGDDSLELQRPKKKSKLGRVRFHTSVDEIHQITVVTAPTTGMTAGSLLEPSLPDFCVQHDFCHQLQTRGLQTPENRSLGYFEKSGSCKHLVSFAPPVTACVAAKSVSLARVIEGISQGNTMDQLLQHERLRLARQLSSAVLQYHATPLLKDDFGSDDVSFFDNSAKNLFSPHLTVQITKSRDQNTTQESSDNVAKHLIRNPYLFRLGVIMLELAYQSPLRSLYYADELIDGQENKLTEYFVATRLSKAISPELGSLYGKIVRNCLQCDFAQGTSDLNNPKLQAVFYKDVVCEVERLEQGFAKLQLNS